MSLLIRNAQLIDGSLVNIFIKGNTIYDITHRLPLADEYIDIAGKVVLPGLIDPHVHFRMPGDGHKEDWNTGSKAAVSGGFTTVLDMPNTSPPTTDRERLSQKRKLIEGKSYVNYGLYMGATSTNLEEIKSAEHIAGVKVYLGSSTGDLLADYNVLEAVLSETNVTVACHSEDEECLKRVQNSKFKTKKFGTLPVSYLHDHARPEECAKIAAEKVVEIIKRVKRPVYFCHVSSKSEIEILTKAKKDGLLVFIEATPHHLFLNKEFARDLGNLARVNPPLRSYNSQVALKNAVKAGIVDTIGTDHAPHTLAEKHCSYSKAPSGVPGLETALPLFLDWFNKGEVGLNQIVTLMSENPALIYNIQKRGKLEPGYLADIVVVDLELTKEIKNSRLYTKCVWSPFAGMQLTGWPIMTIVNGRVVFKDGDIVGRPGGREVF